MDDGKTHRHSSDSDQTKTRHRVREPRQRRISGGTSASDEDDVMVVALDPKDPNFEPTVNPEDFTEYVPPLPHDEIVSTVEPVFDELFQTGDVQEARVALQEFNFDKKDDIVIETAIWMSLDHADWQRELVAKFICQPWSDGALSGPQQETAMSAHRLFVQKAFTSLLGRLGDLKRDVPDAVEILGKLMARAVADDCLPPIYVNAHPAASGDYKDPLVRGAVKKAHTLLSVPMAMSRLDSIFGHSGAIRPLKELQADIEKFLTEYLLSEDVNEAQKCLTELQTPHFHHEVVYRMIVKVLEGGAREARLAAAFLAAVGEANLVTPNEIEKGVRRVYQDLRDLLLDMPKALDNLRDFLALATAIPRSLCAEAPVTEPAAAAAAGAAAAADEVPPTAV